MNSHKYFADNANQLSSTATLLKELQIAKMNELSWKGVAEKYRREGKSDEHVMALAREHQEKAAYIDRQLMKKFDEPGADKEAILINAIENAELKYQLIMAERKLQALTAKVDEQQSSYSCSIL